MRSVATSRSASPTAYRSRTLPRPSRGVSPRFVFRSAGTEKSFVRKVNLRVETANQQVPDEGRANSEIARKNESEFAPAAGSPKHDQRQILRARETPIFGRAARFVKPRRMLKS